MWKRKVLKKQARISLKNNYSRMIAVSFLTAVLTPVYSASVTLVTHNPLFPSAAATDTTNADIFFEALQVLPPNAGRFPYYASHIRAALAAVIDSLTSMQSAIFSALHVITQFYSEHFSAATLFLAAGFIIMFLYQIFGANLLLIGEKRFFLESRHYPKTRISKIFFLYKLRYIKNPARIMFFRSLYQWLWNLTIVGGVIKHYEYAMIPFLLAENPTLSRTRAFSLSRQMMQGNKWRLFLLHLSLLGWRLLSVLTFGLLDFLFVNPYLSAAESELYFTLRRDYILSRQPHYELLSDSYLDQVPDADELLIAKALYDDSNGPYTKGNYFAPEQYPVFLFSVQPPEKAVHEPLIVNQTYSPLSYILFFFSFSILGHLGNVLLALMRDGALPTDNMLYGPWIPFLGIFGILLILFGRKHWQKPVLVFGIGTLLCFLMRIPGIVVTIFFSEETLGTVLYQFFYLSFGDLTQQMLFCSLLGCAFLYYIAPKLELLFQKLTARLRIFLCVCLFAMLSFDIIFSFFMKR